MTPDQFASCDDPGKLLNWFGEKLPDRTLRLFACACVERLLEQRPDQSARRVLDYAWLAADGLISPKVRQAAYEDAKEQLFNRTGARPFDLQGATLSSLCLAAATHALDEEPMRAALCAAEIARRTVPIGDRGLTVWYAAANRREADQLLALEQVTEAEKAAQAGILRCVAGNFFWQIHIKARWRSEEVVSLASPIYDQRDFSRLPELAGALRRAGCEHSTLLGHLSDSSPHYRGCFAVELLRARQ
jgi:hypothetical protein